MALSKESMFIISCQNMYEWELSSWILQSDFQILDGPWTYLTAMDKQALAPPKDMDAIQIRPDKSWSATVRNRFRPLSIVEWNLPKVI